MHEMVAIHDAGLRVPSKAFAITWDMIGWDKKALCIPSKKTRRFAESRVCPNLPELMVLLEKGWDDAPEGAATILTLSVANVRKKRPTIIKEAKLKPWEDKFQTLRRSCRIDLVWTFEPSFEGSLLDDYFECFWTGDRA